MRYLNRIGKGLGAGIAVLAAVTALMACAPPGPYLKAAHVRPCSDAVAAAAASSETSGCRHSPA